MKYIISTNENIKVDGFLTLESISDLKKEVKLDSYTVLIIHSFSDKDFDAVLELTTLIKENNITQIFYINNDPKPNMLAFTQSVKGFIEKDEDYLKDEVELNSLISVNKSELALVESNDNTSELDILNELLTSLVNGDNKIFTKAFTDMVQRATLKVAMSKEEDSENIKVLGDLVVETYLKSKKELDKVVSQNEEIKKIVNNTLIEENNTAMPSQNVSHYPSVSFLKSFKTLVFKEYSACRYLTSFVMGLSDYLRKVRNLKVKTIILTQQNENNKYRYPTSVEVTADNHSQSITLNSDTVFTSSPSKKILFAQTDLNYDVVIILDRTYTEDTIIKNRVTTFSCVSGQQEIKKFDLNPVLCISTIREIPDVVGTLKHINNLPKDAINKKDVLNKAYNNFYETIYNRYINN